MPLNPNTDNWIDWLALKSVPGIGDRLYRRLIDHFETPSIVFQMARQKSADLRRVNGISTGMIETLGRYRISASIRREIDRVQQSEFRIVTMNDPDYPRLLLEIPDPPPYLYLAGTLPTTVRQLAVVGSRNATSYGIEITRKLSVDLNARGAAIVSGMALGIDTAAHEGALMGDGQTVAVLGSGHMRIYPARNRRLFDRIAHAGAVVSEFPLTAGPEAHHFPKRNRIISGICLGTVVVEATRRSGSLITARLAAEQNREVFAVPGSIQSFKSTGTHTLIKEGAKLVENAGDVIEEFPHYFKQSVGKKQALSPGVNLGGIEKTIFDALSAYPTHIDELVRRTKIEAGQLAGLLMQMELTGLVTQAPGKMFTRHLDYS